MRPRRRRPRTSSPRSRSRPTPRRRRRPPREPRAKGAPRRLALQEHGYKDFFLHGETVDVILPAGRQVCSPVHNSCLDSELSRVDAAPCAIQEQEFRCRATDSNDGCTGTRACPAETRVVGAMAACDLETAAVPHTALARRNGSIHVVRASDEVSDGRCTVGGHDRE